METNKEKAAGAWVDNHLAALQAPPDWEPDAATAIARFRSARDLRTRRTRLGLWMGATAVAIGAALLAFPGPRVLAQRCVDACFSQAPSGRGVVNHPLTASPAERQPAPGFSLLTDSGESVRLSSLRGQVVLLDFWATWCPPCKVEIPWFVSLHRQYAASGLSVVGVAMDGDGLQSVRPGRAALGIDYPVVLGDDALAAQYGGVEALPTTFLIDKSGRIAAIHQGLTDQATLDEEIRNLLNEAGK